MRVFNWFRSLGSPVTPSRKLRSRAAKNDATKVALEELAPSVLPYLGLVAYLELEVYEATTRAVAAAPSLEAKDVLSTAAGLALQKQQAFAEEIRRRGHEPHTVMAPYTGVIDRYLARIEGSTWHEIVLSVYLIAGLFDDFFARLGAGVNDRFSAEAVRILQGPTGRERVAELLTAEIAQDPPLGDLLALWGRRLVGDTLLTARGVLSLSENRIIDEAEAEPVFTELIADHIRRMDGLGLTA